MIKNLFEQFCCTTFILLLLSSSLFARNSVEYEKQRNLNYSSIPAVCITAHRVGNIVLAVNNRGSFGTGFANAPDCFTGESVPSCEFPKRSGVSYLFAGAFWVGAVSGRDTLVSTGEDGWAFANEMQPDAVINMIYRSTIDPTSDAFEGAVSEEDYIGVYRDYSTDPINEPFVPPPDPIDNRPHRPLFIRLDQSTYAWSYSYAEDFVLFDYKITNEGVNTLEKVYMGIYVDADACRVESCDDENDGEGGSGGWTDDICGFVRTIPETVYTGAIYQDTVNLAWIADNDGDPGFSGRFDLQSPSGLTGTRIIRTPSDKLEVSFNWWISNGNASRDFGPREKVGKGLLKEDELYDFGTGGLGTPVGDRGKYYIMRNQEFDYDQVYSANVRSDDTLWIYPNQSLAKDFSDGFDTRYLLSFGPFDIDPGETLPLSFSYTAGENFHTDPNNADDNLKDSYNPDEFYKNLSFEDITTNARWSSWIYDNPGVDTDGDGFSGTYFVFVTDSIFDSISFDQFGDTVKWFTKSQFDSIPLKGDGVPDFKGAKPPPAPKHWVTTDVGKLSIRFNGLRSETTPDEFLRVTGESPFDFEGYRVYIARDDRSTSYSLVSSYDRENYNKWVYEASAGIPGWKLLDVPYSRDELNAIYGQVVGGSFDPLDYPRTSPFQFFDSLFYFDAQDFNVSEFGVTTQIEKIYPNAPYPPSIIVDTLKALPDDTLYLTEDGYIKFFEYIIEITDLLPTVNYWVNVTAFDYGSPASGLPSLESSKTVLATQAYASYSPDALAQNGQKVFVYPNPYRSDARYRAAGFEGLTSTISGAPDNRVRRINFTNVPSKCIIRIFSLDGDLVKEIEHDTDPSDPTSTHEEWDLITRNTQLVVSGLYYWSVENSATGEVQIGKLAIIM